LTLEAFVNDPLYDGMRVDSFVSDVMKLCSRSQIRQWVLKAFVNGREVKLGKRVKLGDRVMVLYRKPLPPKINPENISLDVIYEDDNVLVINKPQGMVVHPAPGNYSGTVVNALVFRYASLREKLNTSSSEINDAIYESIGDLRPGIVHRLDKDTSGVLVTAKNLETLEFLSREFKSRRVKKLYLAVVKGVLPNSKGRIDVNLIRDKKNRKRFAWTNEPDRGKRAVTDYRVLRSFTDYSFVLLRPRTGRTHQLRVHMRYLGCPILGDPIYSRKDKLFPDATLMLHAYKIWIRIPTSFDSLGELKEELNWKDSTALKGYSSYGKLFELKMFMAPLPPRFRMVLKSLASC